MAVRASHGLHAPPGTETGIHVKGSFTSNGNCNRNCRYAEFIGMLTAVGPISYLRLFLQTVLGVADAFPWP